MAVEVVVVGGGYAGLAAIGQMRGARAHGLRIRLIDSVGSHELIPELPEALREGDPVDDHVIPFSEILSRVGVEHIQAHAVAVETGRRRVLLADGSLVSYDWLLLSPGSVPAYPPILGLEKYALPLRNARDTMALKRRLHSGVRQRVVVVGGGLTGTEVAGILAPDHDVWLVERMARLLPGLGMGLARYARDRLREAGVTFMLGRNLLAVREHQVELEKDQLHYDVLIWTGGIKAPPWLRQGDLPLDREGYPLVDGRGLVSERVFAAGDVWRVRVGPEQIPQTAQLALLAGRYTGENLLRAIRGEPLAAPLRPTIHGVLVSLNPGAGVGWVIRGGIPVRGISARALKELSFRQYRLKLSRVFGRGQASRQPLS